MIEERSQATELLLGFSTLNPKKPKYTKTTVPWDRVKCMIDGASNRCDIFKLDIQTRI